MVQFTNETVDEHLATLSNFIERSLEVDQYEDNLNTIAGILSNITEQIGQSDRNSDSNVSFLFPTILLYIIG